METTRPYQPPDVRQKIRYQRFEDPEVQTGLGDNSIDKVKLMCFFLKNKSNNFYLTVNYVLIFCCSTIICFYFHWSRVVLRILLNSAYLQKKGSPGKKQLEFGLRLYLAQIKPKLMLFRHSQKFGKGAVMLEYEGSKFL